MERALEDRHYAVRMHALRLGEPWLGERPSLLDRVLRRVDDEHPRVRLQLAMTLGEARDPRSVAALARLAACDADEPWIRAAILSAAVETADELLAAVVKQPETSPAAEMLHPLGSIIGARHDDEQIGRLLALLSEESRAAVQAAALDGLIEGLQRGKPPPLRSPAGRAEVRQGEAHSGTAALAITPPQRWNLALPGWNHRVKETPGPGEFRYLRFAWRSRGGDGVMIELAGDGRWPPAEKPLWRYYSGRNTTGWAAVQVAEERPDEWTVVTRNLWQDFGEFTLTGIAPTAMGGEAQFDRIELLRTLDVRDAAGK